MPRILIVEDSPLVSRLVGIALAPLGAAVAFAGDGPAAVESARADPPDLVVLDIGLPGFDGWEVLRRLRADTATAGTAVLILTAHARPEGADGFQGFLTKPFTPEVVRTEVARILTAAGRLPVAG